MFIKSSGGSGYNSDGEQFARGSFLMLFSHNGYKWEGQNNRARVECHGQVFDVMAGDGFTVQRTCTCLGSTWREGMDRSAPSYYLKYCPVHASEYRTWNGDDKKLYACVRHVSLRQLGHFMMGTARIAGQSVTVSGSYGGDGLPMNYEDLSADGQAKLIEVPLDVAEVYWKGDGWNGAGNEAGTVRTWALQAFGVQSTARGGVR